MTPSILRNLLPPPLITPFIRVVYGSESRLDIVLAGFALLKFSMLPELVWLLIQNHITTHPGS